MQKTTELIEGVLHHLNKLLLDPDTPPRVREAAEQLVSRLRSDLHLAKATAEGRK